ncbi:hypothetical protein ANO14919_130920 [Xylariales sp. No.14919]|nr:hypothetical protein ANO14919_057430 [Xylariales sp. No.14919]GAW23532.1 hypothetical protein ANO14919_130920 [Xylariales sp. No.14919]
MLKLAVVKPATNVALDEAYDKAITGLAISLDGKLVASATIKQERATIWDAESEIALPKVISTRGDPVTFLPNDKLLAS